MIGVRATVMADVQSTARGCACGRSPIAKQPRRCVGCDQVESLLPFDHVTGNDGWMRSLSYDRQQGRLEIDCRWNDVRQFWPVSPAIFKELWRGQPRYLVLYQKIIGNRRMRWAYVRTEGKVLVSMLFAFHLCIR